MPGRRRATVRGRRAATDLNAAVRTVVEFLEAQGMFRGHDWRCGSIRARRAVRGDQHVLEQVVVNLVVNACQAAPGDRVDVGTLPRGLEPRAAERRAADDAGHASRDPSAAGSRGRGGATCRRARRA